MAVKSVCKCDSIDWIINRVTIFYSHRQDKKIFKKRKIMKRKYKKGRKSKNKNDLIPWHFTFSIFAGWFWHRQENTINSLIVDFFSPFIRFSLFFFFFLYFQIFLSFSNSLIVFFLDLFFYLFCLYFFWLYLRF